MRQLALIVVFFCLSLSGFSQTPLLSRYSLAVDTVIRNPLDTVSNDSVKYLTSPRTLGQKQTTTIEVVATKISGTVAGVISLLGSIDEVNYKAILLPQVSTPLNTYTATNVTSQTFLFIIPHSPYLRYRVVWAGTGTMAASFTAKVLYR